MQSRFNVNNGFKPLLFLTILILEILFFDDLLEKILHPNRVTLNIKQTNADHDVECLDSATDLPVPDFCDEYEVKTEATGDLAELSSLQGKFYGCKSPCMNTSEKIKNIVTSFRCTNMPGYSVGNLEYRVYSPKEFAIRMDYRIFDENAHDAAAESKKSKLKLN